MFRNFRARAAGLLTVVLLSGCGAAAVTSPPATPPSGTSPSSPTPSAKPTVKDLGTFTVLDLGPNLALLPVYWAIDKGVFKNLGLNVTMVTVTNASGYPALLAGQGDVVESNIIQPQTLRQKGQTVTDIATYGIGFNTDIVLSKAIADKKGITASSSLADKVKALKGTTMATPSAGSGADNELRYMLVQNGLNYTKDLTVTYIAGGATDAAALLAGQIDGFVGSYQDYKPLLDAGKIIVVAGFSSGEVAVARGYLQATFVTMPGLITTKHDAFVAFLNGLTQGLIWLQTPGNAAEAATIASGPDRITGMTQADLTALINVRRANGQIPTTPVISAADFNASVGFENTLRALQNDSTKPLLNFAFDDIVNVSLAQEAVKQATGGQ